MKDAADAPFSLDAVIGYQDGSIVSKTLLKGATGSITLFAFDRGQELSEHTAPFDAFVHIVDGECEVSIGETWQVLKRGQAIVMPAGIPHALKAVNRFKMMLVMIRS